MDFIRFSIEKPVTVIVGVILILLFGFISLGNMPYQLTPEVSEPEITVRTTWPGASPYEIERDVVEVQENYLKSIPNLVEYESSSRNNMGTITLRFKIGTPMDRALLDVSNKLGEVRSYPEGVERPSVNASGDTSSPVVWMMMQARENNPNHIDTYRNFFENEVRQHIERVDGVSDLFFGGGRNLEMHILLDPERMAAFGLTYDEIISVVQRENINISAGQMDMGRRSYRIRTVAEFESPQEIRDIIIRSDGQHRLRLGDVGEVDFAYARKTASIMLMGEPGMVVGVRAESGTNVVELTNTLEEVVNRLNDELLHPRDLHLRWVRDQRGYIMGAVKLVQQNILIGGVLAIVILVTFLRSASSTGIVAVAIPISIIGTFIIMNALGRSLNIVSLAGISFAVGMLVDSAIVVLENIDRHRKLGKSTFHSCYDGTREVWGAIIASSLTTIAVFLPIVFLEGEAGQLFRDIALAVTSAVTFSLFVSISVIPMLSAQIFRRSGGSTTAPGPERPSVRAGRMAVDLIMMVVERASRTVTSRIATVAGLVVFSIGVAWVLFPKMEYLPHGNQNFVVNILIPPPGLSVAEQEDIGQKIFAAIRPFYRTEVDGKPGIENAFYVATANIMLLGTSSTDEQRGRELIPMMRPVLNSFPGIFGISNQIGIFQQGLGKGRTIDVDVVGDDLDEIVAAASHLFAAVGQSIAGAQVRPVPSLELLYPEVALIPDRDMVRAVNMSAASVGTAVDVLMEGRKVGEFKQEGQKKIDLVLTAPQSRVSSPEDLFRTQIAAPGGQLVPLSNLVRMEQRYGITEIRHYEGRRTITLQVTPPDHITIQEAMEIVQERIVPSLKQEGKIPPQIQVQLSGTADKLLETVALLAMNFVLASAIIYLLMSALFGNFVYPLVVMFTVPLATAGGFAGLRLTNALIAPQALDILTMLGFIILIGVVVNNAILIVHQTLNNIRYHSMEMAGAVLDATRNRLRPIFMSTLTSIFGMLPLVVAPGPGSELYRGLGSVIVGGMALSTVFTILVIPCLLMFVLKGEKPRV